MPIVVVLKGFERINVWVTYKYVILLLLHNKDNISPLNKSVLVKRFALFFLFSDSSQNFLELVFEDHQASQRLKVSDLPCNEHITKLIYLFFFSPLKGLYHKREFQIILINHCRRFHQTWFHSLTFVWVQTSPKGREPLGVLAYKCLSAMVISVNNKLLLALHTVSSTARGSYRHFFKFPTWLKVKVNY